MTVLDAEIPVSNTIYKPEKDVDFYVLWSDNTDFPICWGTRKNFLKWYKKKRNYEMFGFRLDERLARADKRSTSSHISHDGFEYDYEITYGGYGYVLRSQVRDFLKVFKKAMKNPDDPRILKLVTADDDF